jgi:hypothetical protein
MTEHSKGRVANNAEKQVPANIIEAIQKYGDARADLDWGAPSALALSIRLIRAALSGCADGGKGEAVYQLDSGDGNWVDVAQESYEGHALVGDVRFRRKLYTAPQAECAPAAPRAAVLYTMDQMRDYADAFHRSRVEAIAEPKRADLTGAMGAYLRVCSSGGMPAVQVKAVKVALEQAVDLGYFDSILAKGDK